MKPVKLANSPIIDAIIEVRFQSKIPSEVITGVLFSKFTSQFPNGIEALPASQLPQPIRDADPNLRYQATHKFSSETYYLTVGPSVVGLGINLSNRAEYPGWKEFYKFFGKIGDEVKTISESFVRIGVRYINFFQEDEFLNKLNIRIATGWENKGLTDEENLMFFIRRNNLRSKVTVSTAANGVSNGKLFSGQLIDIDTFLEDTIPAEDLNLRVNEAHSLTEEVFFSLLTDEFRAELEGKQ